ncbi:hypothetical protein ACSFBX_28830 [Variovorax sp. RB2P76]|uniref:hypothetical protein n=1 Tax=Variovorax sp. RB2P76 TaxID=3443736 RepID=UPI003F46675B
MAIDGTKVQAVASRKAVIGQRELAAQAQRNAARDRRLSAVAGQAGGLGIRRPRRRVCAASMQQVLRG